jgi:hypothetical protein
MTTQAELNAKIQREYDEYRARHYNGNADVVPLSSESALTARRLFAPKPRLLVDSVNPEQTVEALRDVLAQAGEFYDRGVPVRVTYDSVQGGLIAQKMTPDGIVLAAHKHGRPYAVKKEGGARTEIDARLPKSAASMYLEIKGEWLLPILNGISSSPLLGDCGSIRSAQGYDAASGMWIERVPDVAVLIPDAPTRADAEKSLRCIRDAFKTFCYADAKTIAGADGLALVDLDSPPGKDESTFLAALLTAVCRASLPVAPGALFTAADTSGAGTGKGKLARCVCAIAFGRQPSAVTAGSGVAELEKRLAAKLIESAPAILLDNVNGQALKSELLASAISERPAEIRVLGKTEMATLNASAFIVITGNGLRVGEDLARRFIETRFDAWTEDPESRQFHGDVVAEMFERRAELLGACLTIWRWGRQTNIGPGKPLGSFEQWARWCRDPLLALGCQDPVERIAEAKTNDPRRQRTAEIFKAWRHVHGSDAVTVKDLDQSVLSVIDPHSRGRQYVARLVAGLAGTRLAGLVMTRQEAAGTWNASTYALKISGDEPAHRTRRTHRIEDQPTSPMSPMPNGHAEEFEGVTEATDEVEIEL